MPGFNCRPESPEQSGETAFSLAWTRARRQRPGSSDGTQCAHASHRIVMNALALAAQSVAEPAEHGLSQMAVEIARPFGFPITNSMVVRQRLARPLAGAAGGPAPSPGMS